MFVKCSPEPGSAVAKKGGTFYGPPSLRRQIIADKLFGGAGGFRPRFSTDFEDVLLAVQADLRK
jgi:hypothetical protein